MKRFCTLIVFAIALSTFAPGAILHAQTAPSGSWWNRWRRPAQQTPTPKPAQAVEPSSEVAAPATERPRTYVPPPPPGVVASPNDVARFLAGMPVAANSALASFTQTPEWQQHAKNFEQRYYTISGRFQKIAAWREAYLPESNQPTPVAFYMFSGPDFMYVDQFFPQASVYVLCGTEPVGPAPDPLRLRDMPSALSNLQSSMSSLLRFSFFITKDMKSDLQQTELRGTLPIFYVSIARADKTITEVAFISLNRNGTFHESAPGKAGGTTPGVRITYIDNRTRRTQTLFYFTTDISNEGIKSNPGFLNFCQHFGVGASLLKSSSYLLFEERFGTIRNFVLEHSHTILQDDAGIPVSYFKREKWNLRPFGTYAGPIDAFKQYFQPQLRELFATSNPPPLEFGFGYHWNRKDSHLIVAERL